MRARCCWRVWIVAALALAGCRSTEGGPVAFEAGPAPLSAPSLERRVVPDGFGLAALSVPPGPTLASRGTGQFIGRGLAPPKRAEEAGEGVTLNLVNVPIAQAAKTVLGDMLAVTYSISPKVEGTLTLQTSQPIRRSEAIALFQSALASSGAALVRHGSFYEVVPAEEAKTETRMTVGNAPEVVGTIGNGLQVVQLKYVAASEMKRVLEPIAPSGGIVRTDDARGVITLSGTPEQMSTMLDAISIFDVDTLKGMSFALVPVESSQPDAIANDLQTVFGSDKEGPMSGMVRFLPNKRLHAILVISARPTYLARAEAWVRKLDGQAQGSEKQIYTYTVKNRPAKELIDVVQAMFGKDGVPAPGHKIDTGKASDTNARSADLGNQLASTQSFAAASPYGVITGTGTNSNGLSGAGQAAMEKNPDPEYTSTRVGADPSGDVSRVKIVADDPNNSLVIEASPQDYRRIRHIIENLDTVPNQVLIEVTIAEVTLNDQLQFGLRWYLSGQRSSYTFSDAATTTGAAALNSTFPGFSYALAGSNAQVTLNALSEITKVNVVSSPSLMVVDNKRARLEVGDQVPTLTQTAVGVVSPGAPVVESIAYVPTGVILNITPRINESGRISLDIEQEVSSAITTDSSNIDTPTIRQRRVHTTVLVNDGEALAVGGLIQDTKNVTKLQVPVLGDIPVVGSLFKNRVDTIGKTELVILITPRVVRDSSEAAAITEEYRHKIELNLPRSHPAQHIQSTIKRILN